MRLAVTILAALFLASAVRAEPPELAAGVKVEAEGGPIEVQVGHLVPVVVDWDRDGKKDLLVGQFLQGKIRFYRNAGEDAAPRFEGFTYLEAGGAEISLPSG